MPRPAPEGRREKILAAARDEFAAKGFAAARMEDIAARVGISKAALYLQFDSKDAVFRALVEGLIEETLPTILPQEFGDMPATGLLTALVPAAMARVTSGDIAFIPRLVIGEAANFPELARFYYESAIARILGLIEKLIAHGMARGEFRIVDAKHAARTVVSGVILGSIWRTVFEPVGAEPLDVDAAARAHLDVLLNGLAKA